MKIPSKNTNPEKHLHFLKDEYYDYYDIDDFLTSLGRPKQMTKKLSDGETESRKLFFRKTAFTINAYTNRSN